MTDYAENIRPSRGPSLNQPLTDDIRRSMMRNSYRSHNAPSTNATTGSWVRSQHNIPLPPAPLPIRLPTPVQRLRPLPDPPAQRRRPAALHTVNPSEPLDTEEEQERIDNVRFTYQTKGPTKLRKPVPSIHNAKDKKRTVMGGLVKSIRRIPKFMFGHGGKGTTLERGGFSGDGEGFSTSVTGIMSDSTLPQYVSNPPTPVVAPIPSHPHHYAHQPMGIEMPTPMTIPALYSSPPPEVIRLDDVRRHRSDFRIMPPSINIARSESAHFFPGTATHSSQSPENPADSSSSAANTAERTTVMMYNHEHQTPPLSRQISSHGPGRLSHVDSEHIVRHTSVHGGSQAPSHPPVEIPSSISRIGTPASYLSYVSQPTTFPSTLPLDVKRSSSHPRSSSNQSQSHSQPQPLQQYRPTPLPQPSSTPPILGPSEPIQSPILAHPQPTTDYLKMAVSPPHSLQHDTTALTNLTSPTHPSSSGITSFSYDPSFTKPSSPIERFFKTLYHMPWIAYERITVDYLPGKVGHVHGHALSRERSGRRVRDGKMRRGSDRRRRHTRETDEDRDGRRRRKRSTLVGHGDSRDGKLVSWYKAASSRSKKTSAELDLLTSDLGSPSSPTCDASLGAANGLGLENLRVDTASPRLTATAAVKTGKSADRKRRQRQRKENVGDKQGRTSRSHDHRQGPHNHRPGRRKRRIGSPHEENGCASFNRSPSPLIPAVYPFYYPPYPYTFPYASTIPPHPDLHGQPQSQSQREPSESPNDQTQSRNQRRASSMTNQVPGQPPLSPPVLYNPGIPHPWYTTQSYQPMIAPSPTTMMVPQVYLLHSASHGQLQAQPSSSSGPMLNGSQVAAGGMNRGAVGVGSGIPLDTIQQ